MPVERMPVGVQFTETMRGHMTTEAADDYERADERGRRDGTTLAFTVTVAFDDLDAMLADPRHTGRMSGVVAAPALSGAPMTVVDGVFNLFERDPDAHAGYRMSYRMPMVSEEGERFVLEGFKRVRNDAGLDMWRDTTTLFVTVRRDDETVVGRGIVRIAPQDFARQLTTMRAVNARSHAEGLEALAKFGAFFNGVLREIYGGVLAPADVIDPASARPRRALRAGEPSYVPVRTADGVELKLTRFRGGAKGPVLLTPGFGTSTLAFTIDTVDTNLPEFLYERGYDVWLLDYRASPDLPSASTQFTLDDIARYDYPAAVAKIRAEAGVESIQAMAHCVGSLTFQMAQALGLEGVRSAVCSQLTMHPHPPVLNRIKGDLYLADLLAAAGVDTMTTDFGAHWIDDLLDGAMRLYPTSQSSTSPVLRRILFMYGEVFKLAQLNRATYEAIPEMFGIANLMTFKHLSRIVKRGHVVTYDGADTYLENAGRLKLPIAFLHGAENNLFLEAGSAETLAFLSDVNGADWYTRHVIPDYAHMDCFIGKTADRDVYPIVAAELDKHNPM